MRHRFLHLDSSPREMKKKHGLGFFTTLLRTFRLLRILRVFRLFRMLKQLYLLATGFAEALSAVVWVTPCKSGRCLPDGSKTACRIRGLYLWYSGTPHIASSKM